MGAAFQSRADRQATADPMSHTPISTIVPLIRIKTEKRCYGKSKGNNSFPSEPRHHAPRNERSAPNNRD